MATKLIKAWIDGAVQEIEVEDIISPEQPLSVEDRVDKLEDKHEVVITDGNLLVGNGTTDLEEMTPEEVLSHINGASVTTMTTDEYEALGEDEFNANTLYVLTDSDENGSVQPDWNQNDSTAQDYIKNRPFYTETTIETETFDIIQIANDFGVEWEEFTADNSPTGRLSFVLQFFGTGMPPISFIPDNEYTIATNGVSYTGNAVDKSATAGFPLVVIGDADIMLSEDYSNFRYEVSIGQLEGQYQFQLILDAEAFGLTEAPTELTISGSTVTEVIHKIDPKFLPEGGVGYTTNGEDVLVDGTIEITEENYVLLSENLTFKEGEVYKVTFNGMPYECVAWAGGYEDEPAICIGNGDIYGGEGKGNGEPFSCDSYEDGSCYLNVSEAGTYSIKIEIEKVTYHKIDTKYLPDLFSGSWNDLIDKPFGVDGWSITWDGDTSTAAPSVTIGDFDVYYVSDRTPSNDELSKCSAIVTSLQNGVENKEEIKLSEILPYFEDAGLVTDNYTSLEPLVVTRADNIVINDVAFPKAGIYFLHDITNTGIIVYTSALNKEEEVQTLDEKYIPDTIARVSNIPEINYPVTSVNGMTGDVQIDIPEGFSGSWNDLTDKPFEDKQVLYEWIKVKDYPFQSPTYGYYKFNSNVVDSDLSEEFFIGKHYVVIRNGHVIKEAIIKEDLITRKADNAYEIYMPVPTRNEIDSTSGSRFFVVENGTYQLDSRTTLSEGIWYNDWADIDAIQIIIPAKQIDKAVVGVDWDSNSELEGGFVKNRTHYVKQYGDVTWSGNITDRECVEILGIKLYKVAGQELADKLTNGVFESSIFTVYGKQDGEEIKVEESFGNAYIGTSEDSAFALNLYGGVLVARKDNIITINNIQVPSAGVYFSHSKIDEQNFGYVSKLSYPIEVKKLSEMFIPDTIARVSDLPNDFSGSWNDLTDKPFEDAIVYEWDENVEYQEYVSIENPFGTEIIKLAKISNDAPESEFFIGKTCNVWAHVNGEPEYVSDLIAKNHIRTEEGLDGVYLLLDPILVVNTDSYAPEGVPVSRGMWCLCEYSDPSNSITKIQIVVQELVQLDEKYISDTIARISDIPIIPEINYPVTSVNGQTGDVVIDIPEQVQPDWMQTDETAIDFIKNKPEALIECPTEEIKALFN